MKTCFCILGFLCCLFLMVGSATADVPNVIFVLTDDQGYGDLSCHGNPVLKTPHIDKLYDESIRFTDYHVAPMCTPTRGELLTGRYALRNGAYCACSGRTFMRQGLPTMADMFAANGYQTGIFGKWHLGDNYPHRPRDRGFGRAVYHLGWGITSTPDYWNNDYFDDYFRDDGVLKQFPGYCTDVWFAEATKWIRQCQTNGQPFFAYISTNAPHGPFFAPEKYKQPYKHLDRDTAGFFAMIANLDDNMARLDKMLEETGLRDNTILIFMTDNGGTGGIKVYNAGMRGAKASLYEGGHRVPFFIRYPDGGFRSPGDVPALTHAIDVLPTLIDLCRRKSPRTSVSTAAAWPHCSRAKPSRHWTAGQWLCNTADLIHRIHRRATPPSCGNAGDWSAGKSYTTSRTIRDKRTMSPTSTRTSSGGCVVTTRLGGRR